MSPFRWYKALAADLASVLGIVDPLGAVPTAGISGQIYIPDKRPQNIVVF